MINLNFEVLPNRTTTHHSSNTLISIKSGLLEDCQIFMVLDHKFYLPFISSAVLPIWIHQNLTYVPTEYQEHYV